MSNGGEPELGSGAFYGGSEGSGGGPSGGLGSPGGGLGGLAGLAGLAGMLGGGGGSSPMQTFHPRGHFGLWPSCGCGSLLIILAGILLVCGGCLSFFNQ